MLKKLAGRELLPSFDGPLACNQHLVVRDQFDQRQGAGQPSRLEIKHPGGARAAAPWITCGSPSSDNDVHLITAKCLASLHNHGSGWPCCSAWSSTASTEAPIRIPFAMLSDNSGRSEACCRQTTRPVGWGGPRSAADHKACVLRERKQDAADKHLRLVSSNSKAMRTAPAATPSLTLFMVEYPLGTACQWAVNGVGRTEHRHPCKCTFKLHIAWCGLEPLKAVMWDCQWAVSKFCFTSESILVRSTRLRRYAGQLRSILQSRLEG